jgi:hypothetical protein
MILWHSLRRSVARTVLESSSLTFSGHRRIAYRQQTDYGCNYATRHHSSSDTILPHSLRRWLESVVLASVMLQASHNL